jgi:hypothetical protein
MYPIYLAFILGFLGFHFIYKALFLKVNSDCGFY